MKNMFAKNTHVLYMIILLSLGFILYNYYEYTTAGLHLKSGKPIINVYHYVSSDYGFQDIEVPQKGRILEQVEENFTEYISNNNLTNVELKIATKPNRWDDLEHRRWEYEYMEMPDNK